MTSALDRISSYAAAMRTRNAARVRSNAIIAVLLALLLWETQWPSLRPGLLILLIAYLGSALWLSYRNKQLAHAIEQVEEGLFKPAAIPKWFNTEEAFLRRLMLFENILRTIGFAVLGYGFWVPTGSVLIAVLLGAVYPAISYFALERRNYRRRLQTLLAAKNEALG